MFPPSLMAPTPGPAPSSQAQIHHRWEPRGSEDDAVVCNSFILILVFCQDFAFSHPPRPFPVSLSGVCDDFAAIRSAHCPGSGVSLAFIRYNTTPTRHTHSARHYPLLLDLSLWTFLFSLPTPSKSFPICPISFPFPFPTIGPPISIVPLFLQAYEPRVLDADLSSPPFFVKQVLPVLLCTHTCLTYLIYVIFLRPLRESFCTSDLRSRFLELFFFSIP